MRVKKEILSNFKHNLTPFFFLKDHSRESMKEDGNENEQQTNINHERQCIIIKFSCVWDHGELLEGFKRWVYYISILDSNLSFFWEGGRATVWRMSWGWCDGGREHTRILDMGAVRMRGTNSWDICEMKSTGLGLGWISAYSKDPSVQWLLKSLDLKNLGIIICQIAFSISYWSFYLWLVCPFSCCWASYNLP